ncbi:MAG: MFS transporter, partial [Anaerolineae bacterium]|nr:MFS transporter [Anaerolineae bacterium]
ILFIAIPAGKIADRVGRKPIVIWSGIIAVLGTGYILIIRDLNLLMFGGLLIGASAGIYISSNFALITDIVPQDEAARYMGVAGIASAAGSACARLMGAWIIDPVNRLTGSSVSGYMALYALAGVLYLFSVLAARELPAPQPQRSSEII